MNDLGDSLLRYKIQEKRIVSFDAETESLNLKYARPWDIAFTIYDNGKLAKEEQFYIKWPNLDIPEDLAKRIHFDAKLVQEKGIEPKEAMERTYQILNDESNILVGNNILNYDCMIFYNACKQCGIDLGYKWLNRLYDNNSIFKGMKRGLRPDYKNFLAWQFSQNNFVQKGLKSNVGYICREFNIPYLEEELHGALADARLSMGIFLELIKRIEIQ